MTVQSPIVFPPRSYSGLEQFHAFAFPKHASSEGMHVLDAMMKDTLHMTAKVLDRALEAVARARDSIANAQRPHPAITQYLAATVQGGLKERLTDVLDETRRIPRVTEEHFRVLMMGRTQAGKSTLLEVLTRGDGSRIGDGRQRYTRDVFERPMAEIPGVVLVDTPGVGARDGAEDFALAFAQVADADLVMWVGNDNPGQEETTRALQLIALLGKPVLVVLNCHRDLDPAHKYADFISDPDWAFGQVDEHFDWIAKSLSDSGHRPVGQYEVHADAAHRAARTNGADAETLRRHSRIEPLIDAMDSERIRRSQSRRAIRKANLARRPLELARLQLLTLAHELDATVDLQRRQLYDLEARIARVIDKHGEALNAETRVLIGRRRTWHLSAPADQSVDERWREESGRLRDELTKAIKEGFAALESEVADTMRRVDAEWAAAPEAGRFSDLPDLDAVWLNRVGRVLFKGGGLLGGAIAGGAIGSPFGPVGVAIGAGVGSLILGGVGDWVSDKWERLFHSRAEIEKKRRERIGDQVQKLLDEYQSAVDKSIDDGLIQFRDRIQQEVGGQLGQLSVPEVLASDFRKSAGTLHDWRQALDKATAQELLMMADRHSTASLIRQAWRLPGVAICATVDPSVFAEVALFGADTPERLAVLPEDPGGLSPASAAQLMLGLTETEFILERATKAASTIRLPEFGFHQAELSTLAEFMTEVLGGTILVGSPQNGEGTAE